MDIKQFLKFLSTKQRSVVAESGSLYAHRYHVFAPSLHPDNEGTIQTAKGKKVKLSKGDVVTIKTVDGHTYKNVKLTSVTDIKHTNTGKIRFKQNSGELGISGNGIALVEELNLKDVA